MATKAKKRAAPAAKKTAAKKVSTAASNSPKALRADPRHPEIHPERHSKSGLQELPTGGTVKVNPGDGPGGTGAGAMAHFQDPQPNIGVTHDEAAIDTQTSAPLPADAEHVYSFEQALTLPVVASGTPVKMPTESQLKAKRDADKKKIDADAKRRNDQRSSDDRSTPESEDNDVPIRKPVVSFKDRDRRTMVVVKTKDGLAAMPSKAFAGVDAPNAIA